MERNGFQVVVFDGLLWAAVVVPIVEAVVVQQRCFEVVLLTVCVFVAQQQDHYDVWPKMLKIV